MCKWRVPLPRGCLAAGIDTPMRVIETARIEKPNGWMNGEG
jgi:hypothetical protein